MPSTSVSPTMNGKSKLQSSPSGGGGCHLRTVSGTADRAARRAGYRVDNRTTAITITAETMAAMDE